MILKVGGSDLVFLMQATGVESTADRRENYHQEPCRRCCRESLSWQKAEATGAAKMSANREAVACPSDEGALSQMDNYPRKFLEIA